MEGKSTYPPLTRVEAGVDWLTLTLRRDARNYDDWRSKCIERLQLWEGTGNILKSASRLGYDGISCGGAFIGERHDGSVAIYTGGMASLVFDDTYHEEVHCSRIDVQLTIELSEDDPSFGKHRYLEAIRANDMLPSSRRRKLSEYSTHGGGATYYIGARSSGTFGRIYDKMRESLLDAYRNCWRYETEAHNKEATRLYHYLRVVDVPLPQVLRGYLARWYIKRGILCPFWLDGAPPALWAKIHDKSDSDRRLRWLREQVRPALRTLRQVANDATIAEALGIGLAVIPWDNPTGKESDNG
jgi:replication initiation factor